MSPFTSEQLAARVSTLNDVATRLNAALYAPRDDARSPTALGVSVGGLRVTIESARLWQQLADAAESLAAFNRQHLGRSRHTATDVVVSALRDPVRLALSVLDLKALAAQVEDRHDDDVVGLSAMTAQHLLSLARSSAALLHAITPIEANEKDARLVARNVLLSQHQAPANMATLALSVINSRDEVRALKALLPLPGPRLNHGKLSFDAGAFVVELDAPFKPHYPLLLGSFWLKGHEDDEPVGTFKVFDHRTAEATASDPRPYAFELSELSCEFGEPIEVLNALLDVSNDYFVSTTWLDEAQPVGVVESRARAARVAVSELELES